MKSLYKLFLVLFVISFVSCEEHLIDMNVNPKGVDPATVQPNLMIASVISQTAAPYLKGGYDGNVAGVMQYVQLSGWGSGLNSYDWYGGDDWTGWYGNLRNAKHLYTRSDEEGLDFQKGLAIVMRAFNFGYIADSWGDAPYTTSLNAANGEQEDFFPVFDSQETIYRGIIEELKTANELLSKPASEYSGIDGDADLLYGGSPAQWRKMANTLMLRYYMRVSEKLSSFAKAGIEEIVNNPSQYPIFSSNEDDATMGYIGSFGGDAWPNAVQFDASESNFNRCQLCAGFRDILLDRNDPRIAVWFNKVRVPIKVSTASSGDEVIDGVRYLHPDTMAAKGQVVYNPDTWVADIEAGKVLIDTLEYCGLPIASQKDGGETWNLNPQPIQGGSNVHNSALADMYKESKGDLLQARLISYAEVCFILAEAAEKGWSVGSQQEWYEKGIKASFDIWGVSDDYDTYIAGAEVAYDGSLEQLMVQKYIANWTVAHESWCDWRRTGYPVLTVGPIGKRDAMPLRFQYGPQEIANNTDNYEAAIQNLVQTDASGTDGNDSSWSKFWLLQ